MPAPDQQYLPAPGHNCWSGAGMPAPDRQTRPDSRPAAMPVTEPLLAASSGTVMAASCGLLLVRQFLRMGFIRYYISFWAKDFLDWNHLGIENRPWDESPKRVVSIIIVEGWAIFVNLTSYMYADGWKKISHPKTCFLIFYSHFCKRPRTLCKLHKRYNLDNTYTVEINNN